MKRLGLILLALIVAFGFVSCGGDSEETTASSSAVTVTAAPVATAAKTETATTTTTEVPDEFHIGIVTGTVSQSEDDLRGAEALIAEYGSVDEGGMIQHLTYPDNFMEEQETTISVIAGLADDPLMKAVIVNQAVPGTTEAFRRIKERRPDIICIAGPGL